MNNLKSYTEYAVNTPTTDFVIGFDFNYGTDAVNVTVDDVPATEAGYTVMYLNSTTMRLNPAVPTGVVRLQRETDIDDPDNQFTAGAKFIASNMDENFTQIRHAQQEVRDGFNKLSIDTNEIIDTLQDVGQAAQDAADAAEQAAQTANDAAAQVNDKVSYQDLDTAVDTALQDTIAEGLPATAIKDLSGLSQQGINDARGVVVDSITDLLALPEEQRKEGLRYLVKGYHAGTDVGGGEFYWDTLSTVPDNAGLSLAIPGVPVGRFRRLTGAAPESFGTDTQASLTVGDGGNYPTINAALKDLSKLSPRFTGAMPDAFPVPLVVVTLLSGFVMREAISLTGVSLGWIEIKAEDPVVTIDEAGSQYRSGGAFFTGYHNATLPIIGCLFDVQRGGQAMYGVTLSRGSYGFVRPGCGIRNCSARAIQLSFESVFIGEGSIFSHCGGTVAARVANLSRAHLRYADLTSSTGDGIAVNDVSFVEAYGADVSGAGQDGIRAARGSSVTFATGRAENCARFGVRVIETSSIDIKGASVIGNGIADISLEGGTVVAEGATFETKQLFSGTLFLGGEGSSGETENGMFVKHLDGTMLCKLETFVDMSVSGAFVEPFPQVFAEAPSVWFSPGNSTRISTGDEVAALYGGRGLMSVLRPEHAYISQWRLQRTPDPSAPTGIPITLFAFGKFRA